MDLGDALAEDFDLDFCFDSVEQLEKSPQKSINRSVPENFVLKMFIVF
jgi:hypothetical protein